MSITKTADASVFDVSKGVREIIQNFSAIWSRGFCIWGLFKM